MAAGAKPSAVHKQAAEGLGIVLARTQNSHGRTHTLEVAMGYVSAAYRWIEVQYGIEQASMVAETAAEAVGQRVSQKFHADPRNRGRSP